jgi:hypothetical protein
MIYVGPTATNFLCHKMNAEIEESKINQKTLENILMEIFTKYTLETQKVDFYALCRQMSHDVDLFEAKRYREVISR